ncbi:hypothetical protein GCM10008983_18280 [Lentibacillus halophilus]|uniref:Mga helix-turn-helix domain-containing protein n=1 Tax=Lentibacillus halophilus TaxID=295065 RepID=A0ABN0ZAZ1_9BACI
MEESINAIALKEVGETIDCSYKTVQNELITLREELPNGWSIPTEKGIGIYLIQPSSETVSSIFSHDENDTLFNFMELLLTYQSYSLEAICEDMYVSRNTALQLISSAESFVQSFFLRMKRNPYQIIGSEGMKRLLLFEINLSRKGISDHYTIHSHYSHIQPAKDYLENHYGIRLTNYGLNAFYNFLMLCINRSEDGFPADELPFSISSNVQQESLFIDMQDFFDYLEELMNAAFPLHERIYIYLGLLYTEFQFTIVFAENRNEILQTHKDHDAFKTFIQFLEEHLGIAIWDDKDLLFDIFNLYQVSLLRSVAPDIQYVPQESILRSAKNNAKHVYTMVHCLCHEWSKEAGFVFHESNMISLAILLNRHLHNLEALKANILVLTSRSFFVKDNNGILKTHFEGKAYFKTRDASRITSDDDIPAETDIIITDSPHSLNTPDKEVILITPIISDKTIQKIAQAIDDVIQRKKGQFLSRISQSLHDREFGVFH